MQTDMNDTLGRAVEAHLAGRAEEASQLVRPLFEAPTDALAALVQTLGERWLASLPEDVPVMTTVILESALEEAADALKAGNLEEAVGSLQEAAKYQPKTGNPDNGLVVLLSGWQVEAEAAPEPEAPIEAVQEVEAAPVAEAPPAPPAPRAVEPGMEWLSRGFESLAHSPAMALTCFERVLDRAPHVVEAWQGRGRAQMMLGQFDGAKEAFEHLLKLTPGDGRAWLAYANALAKLGQMDAARQAHAQGLALVPKPATGPVEARA
jgi:tetratricopeptide (TPR) repeat protein